MMEKIGMWQPVQEDNSGSAQSMQGDELNQDQADTEGETPS
jgi:hypothetical protein